MPKKQKIINLYEDKTIHAVRQIISIADEEDLNQFWEFIISSNAISNRHLQPFLVTLYSLCVRFFETHPGHFFEIIIEDADHLCYLTIWNRKITQYLEPLWRKKGIDYRHRGKRITMRLDKPELQEKAFHKEEKRIMRLLQSVDNETPPHEPYEFITKEDLNELLELAEDMSDYCAQAESIGIISELLIRLRSNLTLASVILNHYTQIETISAVMTEFAMLLNCQQDRLENLNSEQISMITGFAHNFQRWLRILFVTGGAHLHFMDRSMRADLEMIRVMIEPELQSSSVDLESIFDF